MNDFLSCLACASSLATSFVGVLGNVAWFRCRACGLEQSENHHNVAEVA